ncbi:MAG TPA: DEAD/DEAH box helicase [Povalibacter sp.]|nr:DEAD/DEAH box helicase [Povalibacter sp.]
MSEDSVGAASRDAVTFADLSLIAPVLAALSDVGYEQPSPIQAATIPHVLAGRDVVGQAQTGTGKTAAFALPLLSRIDVSAREPQALVLVPTRELAIQVAEAFQRYATHLPGFHVLPIYGGQSYTPQLHSLRRGVHVVVGTPGRVMDHLKRGTLNLATLKHLVLDEADEMLRMGFIDDVEWILGQAPASRQIALFSATMPAEVRRIAKNHLRDPAEVTIRSKTTTASSIRQRYWMVSGVHKLDALTRILEAEPFEAMLVFTRTKQSTAELAERLEARGFAAEALNGDIPQQLRERTIARLKSGQVDIVVATDVAARGLDVDRVTHVVNFDVPYDPESYVHRIGRTGRAGRSGEAILFIAPRERNMLRVIERTTRQPITQMELPSVEDVNEQRVIRFNQRITDALAGGQAAAFRGLIERYEQAHNVPAVEIAAALASLAQGKTPLFLEAPSRSEAVPAARTMRNAERSHDRESAAAAPHGAERKQRREGREERARPESRHRDRPALDAKPAARRHHDDEELQTYRVEVGEIHGVRPANIVGAIANEAGLDGKYIGRVVIREDHSFVDLPGGMPKEVFRSLQKVRVGGQQLQISLALRTQADRLRRDRAPRTSARPAKGPRVRPDARSARKRDHKRK